MRLAAAVSFVYVRVNGWMKGITQVPKRACVIHDPQCGSARRAAG